MDTYSTVDSIFTFLGDCDELVQLLFFGISLYGMFGIFATENNFL